MHATTEGLSRTRSTCVFRLSLLWFALSVLACRAVTSREGESQADGARATQEDLVALDFDREAGRLWLEVPEDGEELGPFIYSTALTTGVGSNPIGLDRGLLGSERWIRLLRAGPKLLVLEENLDFRADSDDPDEGRAVDESFADSVLWAGDIEDRDGHDAVDLTTFVLRDGQGIARRLESMGEGTWKLDAQRSAVDLERCHVFPDNAVFEGLITFSGSKPGPELRRTLPQNESLTLRLRHDLLRQPNAGYVPRSFDPRMGAFSLGYADYAASLDDDLERRLAIRHRLRPGEELVYHVDRGAPEPIRSALIEGASWWSEAFEGAGFRGGFRVELLPEGVHPLDARYNVIQWVHRATRGWSYGRTLVDPRTGEILKGHVSLGSLRVRQDRRLFEGLLGTERTGTGAPDDPIELALARIRQLSAHEVGHTLGLAHNFAASTYDDRASVMDYPAPRVRVGADGALVTDGAYGVGVGSWDHQAIRSLYGSEDVRAAVDAGIAAGHVFLSDEDARPAAAAHPRASLWDNGADPVYELRAVLEVRRVALERFGARNLPPGASKAELGRVLAPLYFHHRYQLDAALKVIGGRDYRHALAHQDASTTLVAAAAQRSALEAVLEVLEPRTLKLPERVLGELHPPTPGAPSTREDFDARTTPGFDWLGAATSAGQQVFDGLLVEGRALRLIGQRARDASQPGWREVLRGTSNRLFAAPGADAEDGMEAEIRRELRAAWVTSLVRAAARERAPMALRARLEEELGVLREQLASARGFYSSALRERIERFLERPMSEASTTPPPAAAPPGSPIGAFSSGFLGCGCGHGG